MDSLLALIYIVLTVPFVFSGVCVCLALTKFPEQVSKLYAAVYVSPAALINEALGLVCLQFTP